MFCFCIGEPLAPYSRGSLSIVLIILEGLKLALDICYNITDIKRKNRDIRMEEKHEQFYL